MCCTVGAMMIGRSRGLALAKITNRIWPQCEGKFFSDKRCLAQANTADFRLLPITVAESIKSGSIRLEAENMGWQSAAADMAAFLRRPTEPNCVKTCVSQCI